MVAEWVDGVQLTALDDLKAIGASPARAMQTTVEAFASQIFRSGFLHGMSSDDRTVIRILSNTFSLNLRGSSSWKCTSSQASKQKKRVSGCTYRSWLVYRGIRKVSLMVLILGRYC
jgi:hypothetical protein